MKEAEIQSVIDALEKALNDSDDNQKVRQVFSISRTQLNSIVSALKSAKEMIPYQIPPWSPG